MVFPSIPFQVRVTFERKSPQHEQSPVSGLWTVCFFLSYISWWLYAFHHYSFKGIKLTDWPCWTSEVFQQVSEI